VRQAGVRALDPLDRREGVLAHQPEDPLHAQEPDHAQRDHPQHHEARDDQNHRPREHHLHTHALVLEAERPDGRDVVGSREQEHRERPAHRRVLQVIGDEARRVLIGRRLDHRCARRHDQRQHRELKAEDPEERAARVSRRPSPRATQDRSRVLVAVQISRDGADCGADQQRGDDRQPERVAERSQRRRTHRPTT
jgi:hypothetical protein